MSPIPVEQRQEKIVYSSLPLAVYRELAAHLEQIEGLTTELMPQTSEQFDYYQSQIGGLLINYPASLNSGCTEQIEKILNYYAHRYGSYQRQSISG
ncbi:hypothetical protein [Gloeothece verrucosa]|uniref:Uncharacterized protein n=1 Tax=Gloeothece verrucosa (strain PCC 7822) TaxID=497965 RepID=E0UAP6_GLOV7|nr:hypothetical protein [Gloeothece verrucosa]ADN13898.1 conserved hypothetical protein [Gloeothece verrucosa PCC 7822]